MEQIIKLDPNFAPTYNMLGYARVETGDRIPQAIAYLKNTQSCCRSANPKTPLAKFHDTRETTVDPSTLQGCAEIFSGLYHIADRPR
jgi:hypothetical protein